MQPWIARSRRGLAAAFVIAASFLTTTASLAQERVALVIGNSGYKHVAALINPLNDSSDVAASLGRLGFFVTKVDNASYDTMRRGLLDFSRRARGAEMAIVYFAGHGMEVGGENWLIPIDAELKIDADAEHEAIGLKNVMGAVDGAHRLGLVVLDACRNNPFSAKMTRTVRTRSVARGLTPVEPQGNVLVAYAAKDGTTAADGAGRNSPFTQALLRHIETPGLEISFVFRNVRDDVMNATKRDQQPFVYGSLSREAIYLKQGAIAAPAPASFSTPPQIVPQASFSDRFTAPSSSPGPLAALPPPAVPGKPDAALGFVIGPHQTRDATPATTCDQLTTRRHQLEKAPGNAGLFTGVTIIRTKAEPACRAALKEHPQSRRLMFLLAELVRGDHEVVERRGLLVRAAELGSLDAVVALGDFTASRHGQRHYRLAKAILEEAGRRGRREAYFRISQLYNVTDAHIERQQWLEKAAALGSTPAILDLGHLFRNGTGVTKDFDKPNGVTDRRSMRALLKPTARWRTSDHSLVNASRHHATASMARKRRRRRRSKRRRRDGQYVPLWRVQEPHRG